MVIRGWLLICPYLKSKSYENCLRLPLVVKCCKSILSEIILTIRSIAWDSRKWLAQLSFPKPFESIFHVQPGQIVLSTVVFQGLFIEISSHCNHVVWSSTNFPYEALTNIQSLYNRAVMYSVEGNLPGDSNAIRIQLPSIVFFVVTLLFLSIRLWARIQSLPGMGIDDWSIIVSWVCIHSVNILSLRLVQLT